MTIAIPEKLVVTPLLADASFAAWYAERRPLISVPFDFDFQLVMPPNVEAYVKATDWTSDGQAHYVVMLPNPPRPYIVAHELEHVIQMGQGYPELASPFENDRIANDLDTMMKDFLVNKELAQFGFDIAAESERETAGWLHWLDSAPAELPDFGTVFDNAVIYAGQVIEHEIATGELTHPRFTEPTARKYPDVAHHGEQIVRLVRNVGFSMPQQQTAILQRMIDYYKLPLEIIFLNQTAMLMSTGAGYGSTDSGATWSLLTNPAIDPGTDLAGDIHLPFGQSGSAIAYYGGNSYDSFVVSMGNTHFGGGTGPIGTLQYNTAYTYLSTLPGSGDNNIEIHINPCVTMQILSQSGFTAVTGADDVWNRVDCANVSHDHVPPAGFPTGGDATGDTTVWGFNSTTPFSVTVKFLPLGVSTGRTMIRVNGTSVADVSPVYGGESYGPWQGKQIDSCPLNRNFMVAALGNADQSLAGVWVSNNGGLSWSVLVTPTNAANRYERCAISGSLPVVVYAFGKQGSIGISQNGTTMQDKRGNLPLFSPGSVINILGL